MKRISIVLLSILLVVLSACGKQHVEYTELMQQTNDINLWVYPLGTLSESNVLEKAVSSYNSAHPDTIINITYLDENADSTIRNALSLMQGPDIVLGNTRPVLSEWGLQGQLVDLSDIYPNGLKKCVKEACIVNNEKLMLPLCLNTYLMAINYDVFEDAGALYYLDLEHHTWTKDGFINAVHAVNNYTSKTVGAVYCGGQSGDFGTRSLVMNFDGGSFMNDDHTKYTLDSEEVVSSLTTLSKLRGLEIDPSIVGTDANVLFTYEEHALTFCWDINTAENMDLPFNAYPMCFPTVDGRDSELYGDFWGFSIFNNNQPEKVEKAKDFLKYFINNKDLYQKAVLASGYFSCFDTMDINYKDSDLRSEYVLFTNYTSDCFNTTRDWTTARSDWWQLLKGISDGADIRELVSAYTISVNGLEE